MTTPKGTDVSDADAVATKPLTWVDTVTSVVHARIDRYQNDLLSGQARRQAAGMATLARLRRGAGRRPGSVSDILEFTLDPRLAPGNAPDTATVMEIAAHHALTLYAVHQQSQPERMHRPGNSLGAALGRLRRDDTDSDPILRRYQLVGASRDVTELAEHVRGAVQLLRAKQIPLDYARLGRDLVRWQRPADRDRVRLAWGRDFFFAGARGTDN